MIRVDINEVFPVAVSLVDENTGALSPGQTVYYDIRAVNDTPLAPPLAGTLTESSVEPGVYKTVVGISSPGQYIIYATCSGFVSNTEEVLVNPENIYQLTKMNRHYNISVEDVIRENTIPTTSQSVRNVPLGATDYVITIIKHDGDTDWTSTTTSGVTYAWYRDIDQRAPYKMGSAL